MFLGLIAATYLDGIRAGWLMVGWVAGDWLTWLFVHRRLRVQSEARKSSTIPEFLGGDMDGGRAVVAVAGLIVLVFLGLYAAAQLNAGGKALHFVFAWDHRIGALIGAVIVAAYCFSGGIRASIWTDAAQSIVMLGAILLLIVVALVYVGGITSMWNKLNAIDPNLTVIAPTDSQILACSAAVTRDINPRMGRSIVLIKGATLAVTGFALLLTLYGPDSVFKLATLAWATLAAGLGPLMVIRVFNLRINAPAALVTMTSGVAGALGWRFGLGYHTDLYDVLPGMLAGFIAYAICRRFIRADIPPVPSAKVLSLKESRDEPKEK